MERTFWMIQLAFQCVEEFDFVAFQKDLELQN